jgi:hypothetical protein
MLLLNTLNQYLIILVQSLYLHSLFSECLSLGSVFSSDINYVLKSPRSSEFVGDGNIPVYVTSVLRSYYLI